MAGVINPDCRHQKLKCAITYSSDRQQDKAIVACKFCGFTVEIIDKMLTEETMRAEFNLAVAKVRKGYRIFLSKN